MAEETPAASNGQAAPQMQMALQKIYARDVSFEVPNAPKVFQEEGQPQVQLNLSHKATPLESDNYEVVLTLTVTCTLNERTAYLAEVHQAGVFSFTGFDPQNLSVVLATYCPNVLFPYAARSCPTSSSMVVSRRCCCSRSISTPCTPNSSASSKGRATPGRP